MLTIKTLKDLKPLTIIYTDYSKTLSLDTAISILKERAERNDKEVLDTLFRVFGTAGTKFNVCYLEMANNLIGIENYFVPMERNLIYGFKDEINSKEDLKKFFSILLPLGYRVLTEVKSSH